MATYVEGSNDGTLNGTTEVTIVAAPSGANRRVVAAVTITNTDSAAVTVKLRFGNSATRRLIRKVTLQPDDTLEYGQRQVLDASTKQLTAVMSAAPATVSPDFTAAFVEIQP